MNLTTKQRRDTILHQVMDLGHVFVKDLAKNMEVSEATVRRDLRSLADERLVELVYGGASLPRNSDFSFNSKARRNVDAKRTIGRLAASLVQDGETIFLDSGTTIFEMIPYLKQRRGLCVIVNSARFAVELGADHEVIVLGGKFRVDSADMIGPLATSTLEQLRGFKAFIGADGLSTEFGVTASDIDSSHLYKLAIRNARETVLMVDHSKFLAPSLFKICELQEIARIVTDRPLASEWDAYLNENGIDLITAPQNGAK